MVYFKSEIRDSNESTEPRYDAIEESDKRQKGDQTGGNIQKENHAASCSLNRCS